MFKFMCSQGQSLWFTHVLGLVASVHSSVPVPFPLLPLFFVLWPIFPTTFKKFNFALNNCWHLSFVSHMFLVTLGMLILCSPSPRKGDRALSAKMLGWGPYCMPGIKAAEMHSRASSCGPQLGQWQNIVKCWGESGSHYSNGLKDMAVSSAHCQCLRQERLPRTETH